MFSTFLTFSKTLAKYKDNTINVELVLKKNLKFPFSSLFLCSSRFSCNLIAISRRDVIMAHTYTKVRCVHFVFGISGLESELEVDQICGPSCQWSKQSSTTPLATLHYYIVATSPLNTACISATVCLCKVIIILKRVKRKILR